MPPFISCPDVKINYQVVASLPARYLATTPFLPWQSSPPTGTTLTDSFLLDLLLVLRAFNLLMQSVPRDYTKSDLKHIPGVEGTAHIDCLPGAYLGLGSNPYYCKQTNKSQNK